jgi:hypothetical protein
VGAVGVTIGGDSSNSDMMEGTDKVDMGTQIKDKASGWYDVYDMVMTY